MVHGRYFIKQKEKTCTIVSALSVTLWRKILEVGH